MKSFIKTITITIVLNLMLAGSTTAQVTPAPVPTQFQPLRPQLHPLRLLPRRAHKQSAVLMLSMAKSRAWAREKRSGC